MGRTNKMLEFILSGLSTGTITIILVFCLVMGTLGILVPLFILQIRNILKEINKKLESIIY